jgi:hypothetical protein
MLAFRLGIQLIFINEGLFSHGVCDWVDLYCLLVGLRVNLPFEYFQAEAEAYFVNLQGSTRLQGGCTPIIFSSLPLILINIRRWTKLSIFN